MKKHWFSLILLIFCVAPCLGLISVFNQNGTSSASEISVENQTSFEEFERKLIELTSSEDGFDDYIYIGKNESVSTYEKKLSIKNTLTSNKTLSSSKSLNFSEIKKLCSDNDYLVYEQEDCYKIRNKFSLKRLLVNGKIENTYNASTFITGYQDYNVLAYDTIEETKYAYEMYTQNPSLNVCIDTIMYTNEIDEVEAQANYDYSRYLTWGAEAIDLGVYNEYLRTNAYTGEAVVVVLDTGINTSHILFEDRILTDANGEYVGYSYSSSVYTYSGYSFEDDKGHGTHVSGTICELTPSNVKILPIKVLKHDGKGSLLWTVWGLERIKTYAQEYNIVCANMSLGAELDNEEDSEYFKEVFDTIFEDIRKIGVVPVVSAGNETTDTSMNSPANCDNAIVVSALTKTETGCEIAHYSNFGKTVDISAPGTDIKSAYINLYENAAGSNWVATASGTSMAAPHVSAAVALLAIDKHYYIDDTPVYTCDAIEERLLQATIDLGDVGKDILYGQGMLNFANVPAIISYKVEDCEVVYDGNYHNISVSVLEEVNYTIKYSFDKENFTITDITQNDKFKNATDGKIIVYFKITLNDSTFATIGAGYLNIKPIEFTAVIENQSFTYGEVNFDSSKFEITGGQTLNGDVLDFTLTTSASNASPVGEYDITVVCSNSNYKVKSTPGKLIINKRNIAIDLLPQEFTYGDAINFDATKYTITSGKIVNGDDLGLVITTTATNSSPVGEYAITLGSCSNKNYNVSASDDVLIINPRPITLTLSEQSSLYGESINIDQTLYTITSGSVVNNDDLGVSLSTDANSRAVGEYNIKFEGASNTNYSVTAQDGIYTVVPRTIKLEVLDQSFTYGEAFNFDSSSYQIVEGEVIAGDNLHFTISTEASASSEVGNYEITLSYDDNNNYQISVENGKVTILHRVLKVLIEKQSIVYGEQVVFDNLDYEIVSGSIVNNDTVVITFESAFTDTSGANEYVIEGKSSNKNYLIEVENNILSVGKRKLVIEVVQTGVYGNAIKFDENCYEIVEGDIVFNDDLAIVFETPATNKSSIGTYDIAVKDANDNYDIEVRKGEYTITQRPLNLTLAYQEGTYGDKPQLKQNAYSITSGLVSGDNPMIILETDATAWSNVGSYKIFASTANDNYKVISRSGAYRINKRSITIRLLDQTIGYSFNLKYDTSAYEIMSGSIVHNDDLLLTIYSDAKISSLYGSYTLSAYCDNTNYQVEIMTGTVEIQFSAVSFAIIFIPAIVIAGLGVTIYLLRRKHNREKFLRDY